MKHCRLLRASQMNLKSILAKFLSNLVNLFFSPVKITEKFWDHLSDTLKKLFDTYPNENHIFLGDFNINLLNSSQNHDVADRLTSIMSSFNLSQFVKFPTRVGKKMKP